MTDAFKRFSAFTLAIFLFLCAGFWFFQHLFFLHPQQLPADHVFALGQPFKEVQLKLNEGTSIDMLQFKTTDSVPKGVVLYFHGNRQNMERYAEYASNFTKQGYECWMMDYPGFGKSTGELTQQQMEQLAMQCCRMAKARFDRKQVIIYGKSLGTGLATYLASKADCGQLILETPYYSLSSLADHYTPFVPVSWLIRMNFTTGEYLKEVTVPVTIFHGTQDEVIPLSNALRLTRMLKQGDRFIIIPNGRHNDLPADSVYQHELRRTLAGAARADP